MLLYKFYTIIRFQSSNFGLFTLDKCGQMLFTVIRNNYRGVFIYGYTQFRKRNNN